MKLLNRFFFSAACGATLIATASASLATTVDDTTVSWIRVFGTDSALLTVASPPSSPPSCATYGDGASYQIDLTTEGGRAMLRAATAAYLSGKHVKVIGTGACDGGNKEILKEIFLL